MRQEHLLSIRQSLGLTQTQFAQLLGVHPLTVSKWERGVLSPTPYQVGLMESFRTAVSKRPTLAETVASVLIGAGIGMALFHVLNAAFGDDGDD